MIDGAGGPMGGLKGLARGSRRPRTSLEGRRASRRGSRGSLRVRGAGEMKLVGGAHGSVAGRVASGLSGRRAGGARGGLLGGRGQVRAGETGRVGEREGILGRGGEPAGPGAGKSWAARLGHGLG